MSTQTVDIAHDRRLSFTITGSGSPIVWIAGTGQSAQIWSNFQLAEFADRFSNIAIDLPGIGLSSVPTRPCTPGTLAADIQLALTRIGLKSATFVGLSLGSAIVQELALCAHSFVNSAVLIGTWASTRTQRHLEYWFESRRLAVQRAPIEVVRSQDFWSWSPQLIDQDPELIEQLESYRRRAGAATSRPGLLAHYEADLAHDAESRLAGIRCECLIIYGQDDRITLPRYNERVSELIPHSRAVSVPRAGHLSILERPDAVNTLIDEHLVKSRRMGALDDDGTITFQ